MNGLKSLTLQVALSFTGEHSARADNKPVILIPAPKPILGEQQQWVLSQVGKVGMERGLLKYPPEVLPTSVICFSARDLVLVLFVSSSLL